MQPSKSISTLDSGQNVNAFLSTPYGQAGPVGEVEAGTGRPLIFPIGAGRAWHAFELSYTDADDQAFVLCGEPRQFPLSKRLADPPPPTDYGRPTRAQSNPELIRLCAWARDVFSTSERELAGHVFTEGGIDGDGSAGDWVPRAAELKAKRYTQDGRRALAASGVLPWAAFKATPFDCEPPANWLTRPEFEDAMRWWQLEGLIAVERSRSDLEPQPDPRAARAAAMRPYLSSAKSAGRRLAGSLIPAIGQKLSPLAIRDLTLRSRGIEPWTATEPNAAQAA